MLLLDPPLRPSGDEGRSLLRRELLRPEYHDQNLLRRFVDWLGRTLDRLTTAASAADPAVTLAAMLVGLALVTGLVLALSRLRRDRRTARAREGAVLGEPAVPAAAVRRRAEVALADGRLDEALVDGYRAVALRQVETGTLDPSPGATAHEIARILAVAYPEEAARVARSADRFDATRYGHRPATREDAAEMLALDDSLAGRR